MTDLEDKIASIPNMTGDDGSKQAATADMTNIADHPVNSGSHICMICQKPKDAYVMRWTTTPKLCEACYRSN